MRAHADGMHAVEPGAVPSGGEGPSLPPLTELLEACPECLGKVADFLHRTGRDLTEQDLLDFEAIHQRVHQTPLPSRVPVNPGGHVVMLKRRWTRAEDALTDVRREAAGGNI